MRERSITIWLVLGAALLVALNLPESLSQRGKAVIREFLAPLQEVVSSIHLGGGEWVYAVRNLGDMALEHRHMAEEVTRLRSEMRHLEALEEENQALRRQLVYQRRAERELIPAEVIGRDISGWWQTVRIGKGLAQGVAADMAVVTPDGLVGRTMNVSARTSDVLLISDPASKLSAYLPRAGAHGVLAGRGVSFGGLPQLQMTFINKDATVRAGDEVVTSGLGGVFPRGILIGHIEEVAKDEGGLYQVASVVPAAAIGRLQYGFVVAETDGLRPAAPGAPGDDGP